MERQLVFVPIRSDELGAITGAVALERRSAHTVTPELLEALEYSTGQLEDAEYAAMVIASVAALSAHGERLVLVAEVPPSQVRPGTDPGNGQVEVLEVRPESVTCWFSEAEGVDYADAAAAAAGLDIDTAWDFPQVQELLHANDMLWNDVEEYRRAAQEL
ncbi:hypothetical protein GCM10028820_29900 [Tessaracoccus terricola]